MSAKSQVPSAPFADRSICRYGSQRGIPLLSFRLNSHCQIMRQTTRRNGVIDIVEVLHNLDQARDLSTGMALRYYCYYGRGQI